MTTYKQTAITLVVSLAFFAVGFIGVVNAQQNTGGNSVQQNTGGGGVSLRNPLGNKGLMEFLQDILDVIMVFAVPLIVFMIIYAGFLFVMDRGSDKNLAQAKRALLYAVIGGVIILGAQAILAVVQGTVDAFRT